MEDLISRSALLKEGIRGKYLVGADGSIFIPVHCVRKYIKEAPAVDAVIPVRCGKCINWDTEKLYCHHPAGLSFCGKKASVEGFCCFGERRADE